MAIDPQNRKDLELSIKGMEKDPRIMMLFKIACEGHDYMNVDEGGVFQYTLIPADSSKFQNPQEGITYFAIDDDYTKIDIMSVAHLSRFQIDERGIGLITKVKRTFSGRETDYNFLPINFYDMIGSPEQIKPGQREAYVLFLQRSKTGIKRYKRSTDEDGKVKVEENNLCMGLVFNDYPDTMAKPEREKFHLKQFNISPRITDNVRFPLLLNSEKFSIIPVVNVGACLALYRDEFIRKNPGLEEFYPVIKLS